MTMKSPEKWSSRLYLVIWIGLFVFFVLAFRLFQKQILQNSYYQALAKKQYTIEKELPPKRGQIFVRDSLNTDQYYPIATNIRLYSVLAIPKNINNPREVSEKLSPVLEKDSQEIFEQINNDKPYIPPLKRKLPQEKAKEIEALSLAGIYLVPEEWRIYPEGSLAAHVLGYVDADKKGNYGVEGYYNEKLSGKPGTFFGEKDSWGNFINIGGRQKPKDGDNIYLTIDRTIQFFVENALASAVKKYQATGGTIIIENPQTGAILAMASWPVFDPNNYYQVESIDIFSNPATAQIYEPGSVFKIFGMAQALNEGKITPQTKGVFGASVQVGVETIKTATGKAYGEETMTQVLENSDNVGMVWVQQQIGKEAFLKFIKEIGFGNLTGIDLEPEVIGKIPQPPDYHDIEAATMSFGQGIAVTPIQLINGVSAIANKGKMMQPYVVDKIVSSDNKENKVQTKELKQIISEKSAQDLTNMMVSVVERGYGKKAQVPGYKIAGKTGTAQVPKPEGGGYVEGKNIGSFVGFAPADDPKFVMLVKIDNPKGLPWAEDSAAPVFKEIASWLFTYLQIPPQAK